MKSLLIENALFVLGVLFVGNVAYGQPPMVPIQRGSPQQVQVQVQESPHHGIPPGVPMPSPAPMPVTPPTYEGWRDGWRESWVHEFRPLKDYDRYRNDGFYYNDRTGCYQRDVQPQVVQPQVQYQYQYQYPTYQTYQQPTYCYPTYQQCQPVYQYRQPCSIWPW